MDQERPLAEVIKEMHEIPQEGQFYALTLLASRDGNVTWSYQSHFVRYSEDGRREVRAPSLVKPDIMARNWKLLGQGVVVVRDEQSMLVYWCIGGNALVSKDVAESMLPHLFELGESAKEGFKLGFMSIKGLSPQVLKHAPTPKVRMQVLKRDQRRCRICGRSPDNHVDLELHVHHIRPWARGGLTVPENLITLCHTCHKGLEPHEDHTLSTLINPSDSGSNSAVEEALREYTEGVSNYRIMIHKTWETLANTSYNPGSD